MPPAKAPSDGGPPSEPDTSFETALERLESIVRDMESDRVPLSQLIEYYEEGNRLHQACQRLLDGARGRIEMIRDRGQSGLSIEPAGSAAQGEDTTATASPRSPRRRTDADQAGELF